MGAIGRGLGGMRGNNSSEAPITLQKCLEKFTAEETLDGDNMYLCEKCKKKRKCVKRLTLYRLPKVLVIHIKRFSNSRKKVSTDVHFPRVGLDLREYMSKDHAMFHNKARSHVWTIFHGTSAGAIPPLVGALRKYWNRKVGKCDRQL